MIKKTIKYVNLNGDTINEDVYFNLTSIEQARLEVKYITDSSQTLSDFTSEVIAKRDIKKILEVIEDFLLTAYGKRAIDGNGFIKNAALREEFSNSIAYAELFEQIMNQPELMKEILTGAVEKPVADSSSVISNAKIVR